METIPKGHAKTIPILGLSRPPLGKLMKLFEDLAFSRTRKTIGAIRYGIPANHCLQWHIQQEARSCANREGAPVTGNLDWLPGIMCVGIIACLTSMHPCLTPVH